MVLAKTFYDASYFGDVVESGGVRTTYGYTDYLRNFEQSRFDIGNEAVKYNPIIRELLNKLQGQTFTNVNVLDIGGCIGPYAEEAKRLFSIRTWTVLDLNINTWCERHKSAAVDFYLTGDANIEVAAMRKNEYDVIFSSQFLDCIAETDLPFLITAMNKVAKTQQIHIITSSVRSENISYYTIHDLQWWSQQGFTAGTILIDYITKQAVVV